MTDPDIIYFESAQALRDWLAEHGGEATELWVGFYRTGSGRQGVTYADAVDEALCAGWIDGVRKRVDDTSYTNRFTPRRPRSIWSDVNIRRVAELEAQGRMLPAGLDAFNRRVESRSRVYSYENTRELGAEYDAELHANLAAGKYWDAQPPGYRRSASWWVMSAKRDETRHKRLATLIEVCAQGRRLPQFDRTKQD